MFRSYYLGFNSLLIVIVISVNVLNLLIVNNYKISHLRNVFLTVKYIHTFLLVNSFIYFHNLCFRIWEIGLLFVTVILFIWVISLLHVLFVVLFSFVFAFKKIISMLIIGFYTFFIFFFLAFSEKPLDVFFTFCKQS